MNAKKAGCGGFRGFWVTVCGLLLASGCGTAGDDVTSGTGGSGAGGGAATSGTGGTAVELLAKSIYPHELHQSEVAVFVKDSSDAILRIDKETLGASTIDVRAHDFDVVDDTVFFADNEDTCDGCGVGKGWIKHVSEWGDSAGQIYEADGQFADVMAAGPGLVAFGSFYKWYYLDPGSSSALVFDAAGVSNVIVAEERALFVDNFDAYVYEPTLAEPVLFVPTKNDYRVEWRHSGGYLYWIDVSDSTLVRANVLDPKEEVVANNVAGLVSFAVDEQGHIFSTHHSSDNAGIGMLAEPGSTPELLLAVDQIPIRILVDNSHIYWTQSEAGASTGDLYRMKKP